MGPDRIINANQSTTELLSLNVEHKTGSRFKRYYARAYFWAVDLRDGTYKWFHWGDSHTYKFKGGGSTGGDTDLPVTLQ